MTAPPFELIYAPEAKRVLADLKSRRQYKEKLEKVRKTLKLLKNAGPTYPGLRSHPYQSIPGPNGAPLWESYVENRTASAWRIWWSYGPKHGQITIVMIGPHP